MTEENRDRAMVYEMLADGDLHGAVASPEAEHKVRAGRRDPVASRGRTPAPLAFPCAPFSCDPSLT